MLGKIDLSRQDVYITNMIKCRPPENRDPLSGEIDACGSYLDQQIEMISPKVIVTLGRFSFSKFFPGEAISKARGRPRGWRDLMVYPMYHPAAALHQQSLRETILQDMRKLPEILAQAEAEEAPVEPNNPHQLGMF